MRKILSVLTLLLTASFVGIGYLFNIKHEVQEVVQANHETQLIADNDIWRIKLVTNIKYGDHKRQALDVYIPPHAHSCPVFFFVHGGGWSAGRKEHYVDIGYFYAKKGYITVIVDHRLSPEVAHPAHINDIAKAFAWTKTNVSYLGGDSNEIYICGHSSGAHLVSLLATNRKYLYKEELYLGRHLEVSDIKGVIAISGIYSLGTNITLAGFGNVFPESNDREDASPINFISGNIPPFTLLYADDDIITLRRQAINFHKALRKRNITSSLYCAKDTVHTTILQDFVTPGKSSKVALDFMSGISSTKKWFAFMLNPIKNWNKYTIKNQAS